MPSLLPLIIFYVLAIVLCVAVIWFVLWLYANALVYVKLAFSLMLGLLLTQNCPTLADSGFVNFLIYAVISLAVIFALSLLPRTDCALKFGCSLLVSIILTTMLAGIMLAISSWFSDEYISTVPLSYEIGIKIICFIFALVALCKERADIEVEFAEYNNPVAILADRIIASVVYGIAVIYASLSMGNNWQWPTFVYIGIGIVFAVLAFLADTFLLRVDTLDSPEAS